ncbi:MAG: alpha-(1-_3)-arabinofuranosyltransferase domain-containing protein [Mycobacteriaceae bacterium]
MTQTLSRRSWGLAAFLWAVVALLQGPGLTVADTKHDLTADPWGFLQQALSPWTDVFPLGQLQNQAYGYLFPHGLFFALLDPLPDWLVQRLWWALLLFLAFAGTVKLLEATSTGSRMSRLVAATLFALSPRIITTLGAISSEAWTIALVPWIMLPVVRVLLPGQHAGGGRPPTRRLAAAGLGSAVAVLCLGAVNAVATLAAVVPAVLWWLAQGVFASGPDRAEARTRRRTAWRLAAWWVPGGILACFWWVGPLLILGRYSPPFTDYIESAGITSLWFNLGEVLRGTTSWTAFLSTERQGGFALATEAVFVAATLAVALMGLAGLAGRRIGRHAAAPMPFAVTWLVVLGAGIAVFGVAAAPFSPLSGVVQGFLDGAGAPLRNLHKFDALVHLPLVAGLAHLLGGLAVPPRSSWRETWARPERNRSVAAVTAVTLVVAVATAPAWTGRLVPEDGFRSVPGYWEDAADWLNDPANGASDSRTMILPEARFGRQTWGNTRDEPAQALLDVPWVVRDSVPLVPPEAIRGLDGVTGEFSPDGAAGANPALADALLQQGVGLVLVRTDLTRTADTPGARGVLRTLTSSAASDGFSEVASFGEEDSVRIFRVDGNGGPADRPANSTEPRVVDAQDLEVTAGGPEVLPRLAAADAAAGNRPRDRVLSQDAGAGGLPGPDGVDTVTDTPALREHNYGNVTGSTSDIRATGDPRRTRNPVADYPAGLDDDQLTRVRETGGRITASSSASDPTSLGGAQPYSGVTAAVDGSPETAWRPGAGSPINEWIDLELDEPVSRMSLNARASGGPIRVQATTYLGDRTVASTTVLVPGYREDGDDRPVLLPAGEADRVHLRIVGAWGGAGLSGLSLTETASGADVTPRRDIVVPAGDDNPGRWVLGQEINEFEMRRIITVGRKTTVTLDSDRCAAGADTGTRVDGIPVSCGEEVTLTPGEHEVRSRDRWVSLTGDDGTVAADADASGDRVIVTATSVNEGRRATVDGTGLEPVTVNGWQQGWVVPGDAGSLADKSDAELTDGLEVEFTATGSYQRWLGGGLAGALALLIAWIVSLVHIRRRPTDTAAPERTVPSEDAAASPVPVPAAPRATAPGRVGRLLLGAATLALAAAVAGIPGLVVAVGIIAVVLGIPPLTGRFPALPRWIRATLDRLARPHVLAMVLGGAGAALMVRAPWGAGNYGSYAGYSWLPELLFVGCLVAVVCSVLLPGDRRRAHQRDTARRAGSSTSE